MPAPTLYPVPFPALYLYPLNDSFIPKHISLLHNQRVKIGRQTNAKTAPGERNGYFDSKVLSRQHAEVWEDGNKIFIKDVKSSNGTFINGERLSAEGVESEPFELKSDDIVEFGIDIVGEDNKTVVHHKVAARVACILTEQDAQMAARAEQHQMQHLQQQYLNSPSSVSPASSLPSQPAAATSATSPFPFTANQQQRRPPIGHQGLAGMGGMGGSMRPPGKSGLTFDHILSRLQGELQKSRETGAELHSLNGTMHEVQDTLGGGLPQNLPPFPHTLPPVRPSQQQQQQQPDPSPSQNEPSVTASQQNSTLLSELQTQLQDTQASLALHVEKIRALESALKEQEAIRHEVRLLRDVVDAVRRKDLDGSAQKRLRSADDDLHGGFDVDDEEELVHDDDDMDDAMSISTVIPRQLERVDEEDEEQLNSDSDPPLLNGSHATAEDDRHTEDPSQLELENDVDHEERRRRRDELGRPRTPEPGMSLRDADDLFEPRSNKMKTLRPSAEQNHVLNGLQSSIIDELTSRLASLSSQLESALELSSTLQAQHTSAQSTISSLESKVEALEGLVKQTLSQQRPPSPVEPPAETTTLPTESLTSMINEWKKSVEGQWNSVQEEWTQERERLSRAREEWENKARLVDSGLEKLERMQRISVAELPIFNGNGDAREHPRRYQSGGLATPPSPRSLSSDSDRPRRRRSGSRGRSGSRRRSASRGMDDGLGKNGCLDSQDKQHVQVRSLATPEPSVRTLPSGFELPSFPEGELSEVPQKSESNHAYPININVQTAVGVLVLSIAAAAVVWRVKPE